MITDNLQKQIIEAMKAKDALRVSTLRLLSSEMKNAQIDNPSMTEDDELNVVRKEAKKRKDAIEGFEKGGNMAAADKEREELKILEEYLPAQISDEDLEKLVDEAIKEAGAISLHDIGKAMPKAMGKVAGQADGKRVADLVKQKLQ